MQQRSNAKMQQCSNAAMQQRSNAATQQCSNAAMQQRSNAATASASFFVCTFPVTAPHELREARASETCLHKKIAEELAQHNRGGGEAGKQEEGRRIDAMGHHDLGNDAQIS
jgi:hypothetical protein